MEEKKIRQLLLGVTKEGEIAFADFELRYPLYWDMDKGQYTDKNKLDFAASFKLVRPFNTNEVDLEEYYEGYVYDLRKEEAYDLCVRFDCAPLDLASNLASECEDIRDALDCSLYPELIEANGTTYAFESGSCGQHDLTGEDWDILIDPDFFDQLMRCWKSYHLKGTDLEKSALIKETSFLFDSDYVKEYSDKKKIEEWIKNYLDQKEETAA